MVVSSFWMVLVTWWGHVMTSLNRLSPHLVWQVWPDLTRDLLLARQNNDCPTSADYEHVSFHVQTQLTSLTSFSTLHLCASIVVNLPSKLTFLTLSEFTLGSHSLSSSLCGRNLAVTLATSTRSSPRWLWSWRPQTSSSLWIWTRTSFKASPTPTPNSSYKSEDWCWLDAAWTRLYASPVTFIKNSSCISLHQIDSNHQS